jgi:hypothetical protein
MLAMVANQKVMMAHSHEKAVAVMVVNLDGLF